MGNHTHVITGVESLWKARVEPVRSADTVRVVLEPTEYLELLRNDLDAIAATPAAALGEPVAACPGWTVADLLGHHEGVLRLSLIHI